MGLTELCVKIARKGHDLATDYSLAWEISRLEPATKDNSN